MQRSYPIPQMVLESEKAFRIGPEHQLPATGVPDEAMHHISVGPELPNVTDDMFATPEQERETSPAGLAFAISPADEDALLARRDMAFKRYPPHETPVLGGKKPESDNSEATRTVEAVDAAHVPKHMSTTHRRRLAMHVIKRATSPVATIKERGYTGTHAEGANRNKRPTADTDTEQAA